MAISTFEELSDAVMQAESQGKRYDKNGRPLTSSKGAKGEMQVMDKTFKGPGFGVEPPRDKSLDERARVGRDYLKAMVDRYGDMPTALVAYNWGPSNADRWLKTGSDIGKLPSETKNYVTKILGGFTQPTQPTSAQPPSEPTLDTYYQPSNPMAGKAATQERMRKPAQPLQSSQARPDITSLGPSYQAALALAALGDTDEEDEAYQEKQSYNAAFKLPEEPTAKSQLASLDLKIKSPFAQEEPVTLARGGVVHRADGSPEAGEQTVGYPANIRFSSRGQRGPISAALESGEGLKETGRGVVENVLPNWAGAPVDIATMLMRPFGYDVKAPVGGSESIKEFLNRAGMRKGEPEDKTLAGFYEAGNIGSGLVNPVGATRSAVRAAGTAAQKTGEAAKMLEDVTVGNVQRARVRRAGEEATKIPETAYDPLRKRMEERGNLMYITSPVGRVIPTTDTSGMPLSKELVPKTEQKSNVDDYLNNIFVRINTDVGGDEQVMGPVKQFLETKMLPWLKNTASTVSDPVREALITGKIKLPKESKEERMFPQALINAARQGDRTAMFLLEREYDDRLGIKGYRPFTPEEEAVISKRGSSQVEENQNMTQLILRQMQENPDIMPDTMIARLLGKDVYKLNPDLNPEAAQAQVEVDLTKPDKVRELAQSVRQKIRDTQGGWFSDVLEPTILKNMFSGQGLVALQEPLTPSRTPMLGTPEGIAALGRNQPILHDIRPSGSSGALAINPLGINTHEIAQVISEIPANELKGMGMTELFSRVFSNRAQRETIAGIAKKAKTLSKEGKTVPMDVAGVGTKEFLPKDEQGFQWREITDPSAAKISGEVLGNSIGSYAVNGTYGEYKTGRRAMETGKVRLFALFSPENHIVSNVEYAVPDNKVAQMYGNGPGTGNTAPSSYLPQMRQLIDNLKPKKVGDSVKVIQGLYDFRAANRNPDQPEYLNILPQGRKHGGLVERNTNDDRRYL
jgi:hypothetical protein